MKSAFLTVLLLVGAAQAQQSFMAANPLPNAPSARKFWSAENKVDFSILAGQITVDAITTQHGLSEGMRETNPIIRPLVTRGVAGEAAASGLGFGSLSGRHICCIELITTRPNGLRRAPCLRSRAALWPTIFRGCIENGRFQRAAAQLRFGFHFDHDLSTSAGRRAFARLTGETPVSP
jgi:hypothetical protein